MSLVRVSSREGVDDNVTCLDAITENSLWEPLCISFSITKVMLNSGLPGSHTKGRNFTDNRIR